MNGMVMTPTGQGGARPGAGRPPGSKSKPKVDEHDPFGDVGTDVLQAKQINSNFAQSKAAVEALKAKRSELEYRKELGLYVDKESMKLACSMVMADFAQGMRSMPDDLERKLNLSPDVVEAIAEYIDAQLAQLAGGFELMTGTSDE